MKALIVLLSLVFTASFIHQVVGVVTPLGPGLACDSLCAACWPSAGSRATESIKFSCKTHNNQINNCGSTCPSGYENIHCAADDRCHCQSRLQPCQNFGPCAFGMFTEIVGSGDSWCKTPWGIP